MKELSATHETILEHPRASNLDLFPLFRATSSLEVPSVTLRRLFAAVGKSDG